MASEIRLDEMYRMTAHIYSEQNAHRPASAKRLRHHELSEIGIKHSLFIADIHTRVLLLTKTGLITLPHWEEGAALWDTVPGRDGDAAIPVRPDAYFVLKHAGRPEGKNVFSVFLEGGSIHDEP